MSTTSSRTGTWPRQPQGARNLTSSNSWGGPRESLTQGYRHFAEQARRPQDAMRPESFGDHYSQARQFFISQTPIEQPHIGDALVFELSKCERVDIRRRMVAHLLNSRRSPGSRRSPAAWA
ncbi:catalase-related domain-containing protein [Caulobacter segnis]